MDGEFIVTLMSEKDYMDRLGILGGTFNPIHVAHLSIAEQVRETHRLEKVLFVPARMPPHKDSPDIAPAEDRYRMTVFATESNPCFEVSRIELDRSGTSFTKDTLRELFDVYPDSELFYIIGSDAVAELSTWRQPDVVVRLAKLLVVKRPGFDLTRLDENFRKNVEIVAVSESDVSSTGIRERIRRGLSIADFVPPKVEQYIRENGLYQV